LPHSLEFMVNAWRRLTRIAVFTFSPAGENLLEPAKTGRGAGKRCAG
jgi:hypothetical protein